MELTTAIQYGKYWVVGESNCQAYQSKNQHGLERIQKNHEIIFNPFIPSYFGPTLYTKGGR